MNLWRYTNQLNLQLRFFFNISRGFEPANLPPKYEPMFEIGLVECSSSAIDDWRYFKDDSLEEGLKKVYKQ